jgi:uncharacterized protein involved in exopolysaccharide biosynthesis
MEKEFLPLDAFQRSFQFWWLIPLLAVAGGVFGYVYHRFFPPEFEAVARFEGAIDFTQIDTSRLENNQFTLGDQDQALFSIDLAVVGTRQPVLDALKAQGITLSYSTLARKSSLERMQALWELRFRDRDPQVAQTVVNTWAGMVAAEMQQGLAAGTVPPYVIFDLVELAALPDEPRYFQTNLLVLAGSVIGLALGAGLALSLGARRGGQA